MTTNPYSGHHASGFRFRFQAPAISRHPLFLPLEMKDLPEIRQLLKGVAPSDVFKCYSDSYAKTAFSELRKQYDFDYWAATEYYVRDLNDPDSIVPLILNQSQFYVIDILRKRYFRKQIGRYIITKSIRRCGITTAIQAYILWLQTYKMRNHSYTCGASDICLHPLRSNLCRFLKREFIPSDMGIFLPKSNRSAFFNTFRSPDAIRGIDLGYIHFADMSYWHDRSASLTGRVHKASVSAVLLEHTSLVVLEGNIPTKHSFSLKDFLLKNPSPNEYIRKSKLSKRFNNPFFLNELIVSRTSSDPYYLNIHIPTP